MKNNNQTVIITGANSGIGKKIALAFGAQKANVVVNYIVDESSADDVVTAIKDLGGNAITYHADVTDLEACQTMVKTAQSTFDSVDVLVNNSGITRDNLIIRMKETDFDQVIDVNLKGAWNMSKSVARVMMKQKRGNIINISSVVGIIGNPGQSNYVASKAGLIGLTKSLSKELGLRGIRVNAIAPGFIQTKMTDALDDDVKAAYLQQIPLNAFGKAEDIAHAALFLASPKASYITGQVLNVNGGMI
ncbi:MAG: 3-oxoacyl-[acyl-carrier-protein] reductase [Candidatus Izimaplasma sp.]|nr:3-oxoacyl-[acyl-carrier-protein] reductase [Candidatus Izimaplasma bacterium]